MKKKKKTFEKECLDFSIEHIEKAIEQLEGIGAALDDAGKDHLTDRVYSVIEELQQTLEEART